MTVSNQGLINRIYYNRKLKSYLARLHEMLRRMRLNYYQLVVDICSSLVYFKMTQSLPMHAYSGKLPIKISIVRQLR